MIRTVGNLTQNRPESNGLTKKRTKSVLKDRMARIVPTSFLERTILSRQQHTVFTIQLHLIHWRRNRREAERVAASYFCSLWNAKGSHRSSAIQACKNHQWLVICLNVKKTNIIWQLLLYFLQHFRPQNRPPHSSPSILYSLSLSFHRQCGSSNTNQQWTLRRVLSPRKSKRNDMEFCNWLMNEFFLWRSRGNVAQTCVHREQGPTLTFGR